MIKIKISYQKSQELEQVLKLLKPMIKSCKIIKEHGTRYEGINFLLFGGLHNSRVFAMLIQSK